MQAKKFLSSVLVVLLVALGACDNDLSGIQDESSGVNVAVQAVSTSAATKVVTESSSTTSPTLSTNTSVTPAEVAVDTVATSQGESGSSGSSDQPDSAVAGFGCPFDQYQCHSHCRSIGRRGGYCGGTLKLTCTCYR
jgi:hypothetical protein